MSAFPPKDFLHNQVTSARFEGKGILDNVAAEAISVALDQIGILPVDLSIHLPQISTLRPFSEKFCIDNALVPFAENAYEIDIAFADPLDFNTIQRVQQLSGKIAVPFFAKKKQILDAIDIYFKSRSSISKEDSLFQAKNTVEIVDQILFEAAFLGASDIHVEPYEKEVIIRFRKDGDLQIAHRYHISQAQALRSRIKILSHLDIAENRRPQDGRIVFKTKERALDIRVSFLPTQFGQKAVLRLLDSQTRNLNFDFLQLNPLQRNLFQRGIHRPYGLILVTGPTGSGKTTTLYTALNQLRNTSVNITSVEDPIEYKMEGIIQTAVKPDIGLTFAAALRTILRQDPNIVMVGEIRDSETAGLAIQASMTGHLVLSTLHTNDAPSAASRLIDMGVEPFLISSALSLIVAQRLVRRICPHCKEQCEAPLHIEKELPSEHSGHRWWRGAGCSKCGFSGFQGRTAIFEMIEIDDDIRNQINKRADASILRTLCREKGFPSLRQHGIEMALSGETTLNEVYRETSE